MARFRGSAPDAGGSGKYVKRGILGVVLGAIGIALAAARGGVDVPIALGILAVAVFFSLIGFSPISRQRRGDP